MSEEDRLREQVKQLQDLIQHYKRIAETARAESERLRGIVRSIGDITDSA